MLVLCCYSVFWINASSSTRSWKEFVVCVRKFYFGSMYDILQHSFLVAFNFGAEGMLYSFILGNLICSMFLFIKAKVYCYIDLRCFSKQSVKECLKYSLPLVPNALSWWIMGASDRTIVSYIMGTAANGLLSVSHKFSSAYTTFYTVFNLSWTESASLHFHDEDHEIFLRVLFQRYIGCFQQHVLALLH